jgi:hypothetical protein
MSGEMVADFNLITTGACDQSDQVLPFLILQSYVPKEFTIRVLEFAPGITVPSFLHSYPSNPGVRPKVSITASPGQNSVRPPEGQGFDLYATL